MKDQFVERVRSAGVVGCGGAGFPAHIKAGVRADTVIANGAECEPLLHKDLSLMIREPQAVVDGLRQLMSATGAVRGIIGVKKKYEDRLVPLKTAAEKSKIDVHFLGDFYPTGDEYVLVYETTRRLIPPQGIPPEVGVVVSNVETLRNMTRAAANEPVTRKYVTIAGAVQEPITLEVPVGTSFGDLIEAAGGPLAENYAAFVGGVMMGRLTTDMTQVVTKTCAGLVVLPDSHRLVQRKSLPTGDMHRIGKSACDQCSYCTEFCPRYLLGYDVQPHKVMRSLGFTPTGEDIWNQHAALCCACGLCTLYACPEDLYPKEACDKAKGDLKVRGLSWKGDTTVSIHPVYDGRHVPLGQLIRKLGIMQYDLPAPFTEKTLSPARVSLPLLQHVGAPARPVVTKGDRVRIGQTVAEHSGDRPGANIHASIEGTVSSVGDDIVIEQR